LKTVWRIATEGGSAPAERKLNAGALDGIPHEAEGLAESGDPAIQAARHAIMESVRSSCGAPLGEALSIQAKHSAGFMTTPHCRRGRVGAEYSRTVVD